MGYQRHTYHFKLHNPKVEFLCRLKIVKTHLITAMASAFFKSFFPVVRAEEEEMVDQQQELRVSWNFNFFIILVECCYWNSRKVWQNSLFLLQEKCSQESHAAHLHERYVACNDRVNSKSKTSETCSEELFDYLHALDHCVSATLFSKLKWMNYCVLREINNWMCIV